MRNSISILKMTKRFAAALMSLAIGFSAAHGQSVTSSLQKRQLLKSDPVTYLSPEQVNVVAGKPSTIALRFRVVPGMHINSHTPTDEFLIPTTFSITEGSGVKLQSANYPTGTLVALPVDPSTKLSVYTGEFVIEARVVAAPGNHLVQGQLRYQACDNNQCLPPKTITAAIDVIAK
jgi:hypothetical protein